jgi:protein TonB
MFDKLVESGARGKGGRTGKYFIGASLFYALGLLSIAVATVMWFNPGMAEAFELTGRLVPPPNPIASQPTITTPRIASSGGTSIAFIAPQPTTIPQTATQLPNVEEPGRREPIVRRFGSGGDYRPGLDGPIGSREGAGRASPPPPPSPTPTPQPSPSPTVAQTQRVSEKVLQGNAINRITPPYPDIAKRARIQGPVQVLVTISEEGRVIDANVVSGSPLLRSVALDAARRWVFTPTRLGSVPVKVQGVLTFNFVLN